MKRIDAIQDGTVIDHLKPGTGRKVLDIIGSPDDTIMLGVNLSSTKFEKKDIIKYTDKTLSAEEIQVIAALAPEATVSVISSGKIVKKEKLRQPDIVEKILKCQNPKCITNFEYAVTKFYTKPALKCFYCERTM